MKRHWISTLIATLFLTLVVTGVMGFFLPFNIFTVSVHALVGFVFAAAIALHVKNNWRALSNYFTRRSSLGSVAFTVGLVTVILFQPPLVTAIIGLSSNVGPDPGRFEIDGQRLLYRYEPAPNYRMHLELMGGDAFEATNPPFTAIWIENRSGYHIKTLYHTSEGGFEKELPYWSYKRREYLKHRAEHEAKSTAEQQESLDAISSATENDSFDPIDYIVPKNLNRQSPYRVMLEINKRGDGNIDYADQPSLVYSVEIDNSDARTFQVLEILGYPQTEEVQGDQVWSLFYPDETITTVRGLLDSGLLRIARGNVGAGP